MAILVLRCQTDLVESEKSRVEFLPAEFFSFGRPCAACEISLQNRSISDCNSLWDDLGQTINRIKRFTHAAS